MNKSRLMLLRVFLMLFFTCLVSLPNFSCVKQAVVTSPASKPTTTSQNDTRKPLWVDQESALYPPNEYLTGIGTGSSKKTAEDAARASIANIFSANIQARTLTQRKYEKLTIGNKVKEAYDLQFDSSVRVVTNKVLQDIKIVERWYDEQQQIHIALAAINRQHNRKLLRSQIAQMDIDIQALRQQSKSATDRIASMRALHKAMKILLNREIYNTDLKIVDLNANGIGAPYSLSDIQQEIQNQLSNDFPIGVRVSGSHNGRVRSGLIEALTKEGFSVDTSSQGSDAVVLVDVKVSFENSDLPKYKFVRWQLSIILKNKKTNKIIGGFEREGKEAHKSVSEAENRAVRSIQKSIEAKIGSEIISLIFSDRN